MKKAILLLLFLLLAVAGKSQTQHLVRIYLSDGQVDTVRMQPGAAIIHEQCAPDGTIYDDYVAVSIPTVGGGKRHYLIAQIDSLVMPTGHRVVFHGSAQHHAPSMAAATGPRRTSFNGTFPGQGTGNVTFLWSDNDHIRLDNGSESRAEQLTGRGQDATFIFDEELNADAYTVFYPDNHVTIPIAQTQSGANNTNHIGSSGDCGIATASRQDDGTYAFTLSHKAAYLCFLPHIDHLPSAHVTRIVVTSSADIAGIFALNANGLTSGSHTSKTITLDLEPQRERDFFLGHNIYTEQDSCAAYMVVKPQTESCNFSVTYYVSDTLSRIDKVYQQFFSLQPTANTVYPITYNIRDNDFRTVDMGLSVNWLNANVGAREPSQQGTLFADDASANAALLAQTVVTTWLMPTAEQRQELLEKCSWQWSTYNGVSGYIVTSPAVASDDGNAHRLFIPAASDTPVTPEECLRAACRPVEVLAIDLGLESGAKWATRNVGAVSAEDNGDYYAWGETTPKTSYTASNYLYGTRNLGNNRDISGTQNDPAFLTMGGSWQMPNKTQWEELVNKCKWTWTSINGKGGYLIEGANGNRIFLPAAGVKSGSSVSFNGTGASYHTSLQAGNNSDCAWTLVWSRGYSTPTPLFYDRESYYPFYQNNGLTGKRYTGRTVRAIIPAQTVTKDGMELTIHTDSASWRLGDTRTTLYATLRNTTPIKGSVTTGFVIGDSAAITRGHARWEYAQEVTTGGRITAEQDVYDNIGYWYRAFVATADTVLYGEALHYGYEMVDLGLTSGTLWANMNLGADAAEDAGYYFAWGETSPKTSYEASTYRYGTTQNLGVDYDISGTDYDAAHVVMGNAWRMPTHAQMQELRNECDWTWVTQNNTNGYRVTSRTNGNAIFLPEAGVKRGTTVSYLNSGASYFTSTQAGNYSEFSYTLSWANGYINIYNSDNYYPFYENNGMAAARYRGRSVRAVATIDHVVGDGMALTILTDSATWRLGDTSATLYGTLSSTQPFTSDVTAGFVIGDSATITRGRATTEIAQTMSERGRLTASVDVYDNLGYWYRAFVATADTVFYGEAKHFGLELVDLGLPSGTLWANMNVGASRPEEFGGYYAWGESEEKTTYTTANYAYATTRNLGNDYDIGGSDRDPAHIHMGNAWRLPTDTEAQELVSKCIWTKKTLNNVNGYLLTGPNGNTLFLPAGGFKRDGVTSRKDEGGSYLTSRQVGDGSEYAYTLSWSRNSGYFNIYNNDNYYPFYENNKVAAGRYMGRSVRAVFKANHLNRDGRTMNIVTDSATWNLGDTRATVYATLTSTQPMDEGFTAGIVLGKSRLVTKATADIIHTQTMTAAGSMQTTVDVVDNMGYWYRAYTETPDGTVYGEAKHFGWEMVDLGLPSGTLWANVNVTVGWPEETGSYYAWGETEEKYSYTEGNYVHWASGSYPLVGNNGDIVGTEYDAAAKHMGSQWQMPTNAQMSELLNSSYCSWTWHLVNGVKGYRVTSLINGNSIFLPATGLKNGETLKYFGNGGSYYSSRQVAAQNVFAHTLSFYYNGGNRNVYNNNNYYPFYENNNVAAGRYMGRCIRAVAVPQTP